MDPGITVYNYMDTFYCCQVERDRWCEEMVSEHMLVYLCSGEMDLITPNKEYHLKKGDAFFIRCNHLVKKVKRPSANGQPFKGLFLQLKMPFLKRLIDMHAYPIPMAVEKRAEEEKVFVLLEKHPFLNGLFSSLEQYFDAQQYPSKMLMEAKMEEAVFMLLQLHPELTRTLFDFTETWKIDLKEFMDKNYKCDLTIEQFAHYSGRSLSSFKKDFAQIFHLTPSRWIVRRRLEEAHHLIEKFGKKPSEVYWEVGFKNLSHFSTAFKKEYGVSPSAMVDGR